MTVVPRRARVIIEFQSYWTAGFGGGRGRHLDTACYRDDEGFPAMPMTQVKGILRETADLLAGARASGWTELLRDTLFGPKAEDGSEGGSACLKFAGDARMSPADRALFQGGDERSLFRRLPETAIGKHGAAQDRTLRYLEAAIPVRLFGMIDWDSSEKPPAEWVQLLDSVAAHALAFGRGKNDGYGRAIARVEPMEVPLVNTPDLDASLLDEESVMLILRQKRPAIFSERAATDAAHKTMKAPTGASLLGWCAAKAAYQDFGSAALDVFHSGAVRFGNSVPLEDDRPCLPFPKNLFAPKNSSVVSEGNEIDVENVHIGSPQDETAENVQFEPVKRDFLTETNRATARVDTGQRLRTATEKGRAARSQLFGYQHLDAAKAPVFASVLSRDRSVGKAEWERVLKAFHGQNLSLGRARTTGYGGDFECEAVQIPNTGQEYPSAPAGKSIKVLAMSDLALIDPFGCPTCYPEPEALGLPGYWVFSPRESVLSLRRYAPWNGQLRSRDIERNLIEAGSVMVFEVPEADQGDMGHVGLKTIGAWQEIGCGRIWVNPRFLNGIKLDPSEGIGAPKLALKKHPEICGEDVVADTAPSSDLLAWYGGGSPSDKTRNDVSPNPAMPEAGALSPGKSLHLLRVTLRAETPVSAGSGGVEPKIVKRPKKDGSNGKEEVEVLANAIQRDANDLPTVPGATTQGILRHLCADSDEQRARKLFGYEDEDGSGRAAKFTVSWAQVHGSDGMSVAGLHAKNYSDDAILQRLADPKPLWRDHVALNAQMSADDHKKYARIAVPAGTCFSIELSAWGEEDSVDDLIEAASLMLHRRFRIGGASGRGYGRVKVAAASYQSVALGGGETIRMLRSQPASVALEKDLLQQGAGNRQLTAPRSDVTEIVVKLRFTGVMRIGGVEPPTAPPTKQDNVLWALREDRIDPERGVIATSIPLTGSSVRGPVAHRMAYYAHKRCDRSVDAVAYSIATRDERKRIDDDLAALSQRPAELHHFLGNPKERLRKKMPGRASRVSVDDVVITGENTTLANHLSIERFSGGAREITGVLFQEEWLSNVSADVVFSIREPADPVADGTGGWDATVVDCFLRALRDLCSERLPIGARSLGVCKGTVSATGQFAQEWQAAIGGAGLAVSKEEPA